MKTKRILSTLLATVLILTSLNIPTMAVTGPSIDVGTALYSDGKLYFSDLTVSGGGIRTLLISFSENVTNGDKIVLPTASIGFTVSSTSNDYTKRINVAQDTLISNVQNYLRGVGFTIAGDSQAVSITVTTENITADTFYNIDTGHYYQYITAGPSGITWTDAYTAAKGMTYMGRNGYLATVTNLDEDTFLNSLSGGKTGWLGGTIMKNNGSRVNASGTADVSGLYYGSFTDSVVSTGWYWACGPEIATIFYSVNSTRDVSGTSEADRITNADATADADNPGTYYNWPRNGGNEPNNSSPNNENCLTTLKISGLTGKHDTAFSWNDIRYNNTDQNSDYSAKGYFVEYGNGLSGDNGIGSSAFATDSSELSGKPMLTAGAVCRTSDTEGTVKFTSDRGGTYYYAVVADGAAEPAIDTSGTGTACIAGENTVANPVGLTAGAKDIYIKAKDTAGKISNVLKIDIPVPNDVKFTVVAWQNAAAYTCGLEMSSAAKMITISVNSGYFTVPSLGSGTLTFLGGTNGTSYLSAYTSSLQQFNSAVFSFANAVAAETYLSDIVYTTEGEVPQTITASVSSVSPQGNDMYFDGHFYRYVSGSIDWQSAVLAAGGTEDPYFGGRGYIVTATNQAENSILLKLTDTGGSGSDHWYDAWMGGLWQRNTGTVPSPSITRGTNGNEITYANLLNATATQRKNMLLDYSIEYGIGTGDIYTTSETVKYYWIDGPEAGQEIIYNVETFSPWHSGEPNSGDFIYIGWEGAYWDDLSAYSNDNTTSGYAKLNGYIVEFSGFDGGSTSEKIKEDAKTITADTTAPALTAGAVTRISHTTGTMKFTSSEAGQYYYAIVADGTAVPTIDTSGTGTACIAGENTITNPTGLTAGAKDLYIKVKDTMGNVSSLLKIDIAAYNTAPVFAGSITELTVEANSTGNDIRSLLHVSDSDSGQALTWSQRTAPGHGTLSFSGATASAGSADITSGGSITYTPTTNYCGADSFTIQVSDGTATVARTITVIINDKIAPTATITQGPNHWNSFLNAITFGLFFKETVTVSITAYDEGGSDVKSISYYKSACQLTEEEVRALTAWSNYTSAIPLTPTDAEKFIIYAKTTDNAGNVSVISSDGMEFDLQAPSISTNYTKDATSIEATVTDSGSGVDAVTYTVNGGNVQNATLTSNKFTISALPDGKYDVVINAKDILGNESSLTVHVVSLHIVTFKLFDGDTATTLKTETVEYGSSATAPTEPARTGFTFKGWDKLFNNITADTSVNATWNIGGITVTPYTAIYDGSAHNAITVTGTLAGDVITFGTNGTDFSAVCPQITNAGNYNIYVKVERTGYTDWETELKTAVISRKEITANMIAVIPSTEYTGQPFSPLPEITFGSLSLVKDVDYNIRYSDNTGIGLATVTITGKGNYSGIVNVQFAIYAKNTGVSIGDQQTPQVMAEGLENLYGDESVYTEKDRQIEQNGGTVKIELSVQTKINSDEDQEKIKELAQDKAIGLYLDISLYKTVALFGELTGNITEISHTNDLLTVIIPIPDSIKGQKGIALYRVHDGVAAIIPIGKENAIGGEYCTIDDQNITLYVCNFSLYAIAYNRSKDPSAGSDEIPDTGDHTNTIPLIALGISSLMLIIVLKRTKRTDK